MSMTSARMTGHKSSMSLSGQNCLAPMPVVRDQLGSSQLLDGSKTQNNYYSQANIKTTDEEKYPLLNKMIRRQNGMHFSKRVVFDHSKFDNFLGQIVE